MKLSGRYRMLFLFFVLLSSPSLPAQSLTLYAIPAPHKINWKSPHHLVVSMAWNFLSKKNHSFSPRPLGHIVVELKKDGDTVLTGMSSTKKRSLFKPVFKEKYGLGVLFKIIDGRLEKKEPLFTEIEARSREEKIAFITFNISDTAYNCLKNYIDSFQLLGYDKLYNGLNDPRHGTGSGCSAFGISFLELINILDPEFPREWTRNVAIPYKLIGGDITGNKVRLRKVLFSFSWAKNKMPYTPLKLYDPFLIYSWIEKKYDAETKSSSGKYMLSKINGAKGLVVECRQTSHPQLPMFTGMTIKH